MNRKIKFRVWDNADKRFLWFFNSDILDEIFGQSHSDAPISERTGRIFVRNSSDYVLQQFTGLLDKNGNEIYSGDIVRCSYGAGKVIYHCGCFMVEWIDDDGADMEFLFSHDGRRKRQDGYEFEVIGNIYENPELLNK